MKWHEHSGIKPPLDEWCLISDGYAIGVAFYSIDEKFTQTWDINNLEVVWGDYSLDIQELDIKYWAKLPKPPLFKDALKKK